MAEKKKDVKEPKAKKEVKLKDLPAGAKAKDVKGGGRGIGGGAFRRDD